MAKVKYTTPKGVAQYPWLKEGRPDTKFDEEGFYRTNVVVDADAAKTLVDTINQYGKDNLGAKMSKAQLPYETDDVTGAVTFKMKSRYAPKMKDSEAQLMASPPTVFGGSVIRTSGTIGFYEKGANVGVKLNLAAVQVIELSQRDDDDGFDAVEGGYKAPAATAAPTASDDDDDFSDEF